MNTFVRTKSDFEIECENLEREFGDCTDISRDSGTDFLLEFVKDDIIIC